MADNEENEMYGSPQSCHRPNPSSFWNDTTILRSWISKSANMNAGTKADLVPVPGTTKRITTDKFIERIGWCVEMGSPKWRELISFPIKSHLYRLGVPLVGTELCKIAIFESENGIRGVYSVKDIKKGEVFLTIPLRLAILQHRFDAVSNKLTDQTDPWNVRLACKLLREKALGEQSPHYPYIQSLPKKVDCVLSCFSYEDIQAIQYKPALQEVEKYIWLITDAWQNLYPEAHAHSTRDEFDWAMTVVNSRTYGANSKHGQMFYHLLVPLGDMFNHAGEYCHGLYKNKPVIMYDVDWEIIPLERSISGEWEMEYTAKTDIPANQQLLISYGNRNNDDFFLYYGFIPPFNAYDDYFVFSNLKEAVDWYASTYLQNISPEEKEKLKTETLNEGLEAKRKDEDPKIQNEEKVRIVAGGFIEGPLMATFECLAQRTDIPLKAALSERCWELLTTHSDLLDDLKLLVKYLPESEHNFPYVYEFYSKALAKYEEAGGQRPTISSGGDAPDVHWTYPLQMTKIYEIYKKIILWDVLLGLYR